jgi:hypothetical protein
MSMFHIATTTVGAGNASQVTFASIPQQYTHLQLRVSGRGNTSFSEGLSTYVRLNGDSGNNYSWHRLRGNGASAFSDSGTTTSVAAFGATVGDTGVTNVFGALILDILDYTNTSKNKTFKGIGGVDRNGSGNAVMVSALWMSTSAVTSMTIDVDSSTWLQGTQISLYGITTAAATGA